MNKTKKEYRFTDQELLNEAIRIADEIIATAEHGKDGTAFQTIAMDSDLNVYLEFSSSIYKGNEGICIFFIELYKYTGKSKYLFYAEEGMKYVMNYFKQNPESGALSFITGKTGTAYTLIMLFEATGKKEYYNDAEFIIKSLGSFIEKGNNLSEYINGAAGILMGMLLIHSKTGLEFVLELINNYTGFMIKNIFIDNEGIFWDRDGRMIKSLCGFSHGASGIGYVFLELGRYFKNDAFFLIAEQAFLYEKKYYAEEGKNWTDLRKGIWKEKDLKIQGEEYIKGNMEYFTSNNESNTSAWCHGAMGIGLSRLRAFETLGNRLYRTEAEICLENVTENFKTFKGYMNPTVCHGIAGIAELYLEAYRIFNDNKYFKLARKQADEIIQIKKSGRNYQSGYLNAGNTEDYSLFIGNAGMGYFFLRLLTELKSESFLMPQAKGEFEQLNKKKETGISIEKYLYLNTDRPELLKHMLSKNFKHTLSLLGKFNSSQTCFADEFGIKDNTDNIAEKFKEYITKTLQALPNEESEILKDALNFEYSVFEFDRSISSYCYLYIKSVFDNEAAAEVKQNGFWYIENMKFKLSDDSKIISSKWDWSEGESILNNLNSLNELKNSFFYLLKQKTDNTEITRINTFTLLILDSILEGKSIIETYNIVTKEIEPGNEIKYLRAAFEAQVTELIRNGIISKTEK